MSTPGSCPPDKILVASKATRCLPDVELLEEWVWYEAQSKWARRCRLSIESANTDLIPNQTDWYVLVDRIYPNGDIDLAPAKTGGMTRTFKHQYYNGVGETDVPWRQGVICAKTAMFYLRKRAYDEEPFEVEGRLAWHLGRARGWLQDAANGTLADEGDAFELPDYNCLSSPFTVAYCESSGTLTSWSGRIGKHGVALLGLLRKPPNTYVLLSFNDSSNKVILEPVWNAYVRSLIMEVSVATWTLFPDVIVLPPWQAPMTWGELGQVAKAQGLDYARLLAQLIWPFTWGGLHFALLGFRIAKNVGGQPDRVHWQALRFRAVSDMCGENLRERDPTTLLWQKSQNWHPDETMNRGRFGSWITNARILLVGVGAIGSMVAEMLIRGGTQSLTMVDPERTEVGNLARHTLTLADVDMPKTEAMVTRLSCISPQAAVSGLHCKLEQLSERDVRLVREHNIIIDCTGSDDVLSLLEDLAWSSVPTFCSISVGLQARRLYVLVARKRKFPRAFFVRHVDKWLRQDTRDYDGTPLPRSGGVGCWHPAFPARVDDIWLLAATAMKYIDRYVASGGKDAKLAVFEQMPDGRSFEGVKLVKEECDNG
jgi:hypothetical protein